jgi:hypothetical protein
MTPNEFLTKTHDTHSDMKIMAVKKEFKCALVRDKNNFCYITDGVHYMPYGMAIAMKKIWIYAADANINDERITMIKKTTPNRILELPLNSGIINWLNEIKSMVQSIESGIKE